MPPVDSQTFSLSSYVGQRALGCGSRGVELPAFFSSVHTQALFEGDNPILFPKQAAS